MNPYPTLDIRTGNPNTRMPVFDGLTSSAFSSSAGPPTGIAQ